MSAPQRLMDGGGTPFEMALLRSAKNDGPPSGALERAMAVVGVGDASGGAEAGPSSSIANGSHGLARWFFDFFGWLTVTIVGGALFVGAPLHSADQGAPSALANANASAPAGEQASAADQGAGATAPSREAAASAKGGAATDAANQETAARAQQEPQARAPKTAKVRGSTLAEEIALLDEARRAIARGDSAAALATLDRHSRDFAGGSLRAEAAVLRVDAMVARGDRAGAAKAAGELLAADPTSPHASHLRAIQSAGEQAPPASEAAPAGQAARREAPPSP